MAALSTNRRNWGVGRIAGIGVLVLIIGGLVVLAAGKGFAPVQYVQLTLDGLRAGAIYALIALGFVLVYNVTGIINFSQGAFVMLGAMISADLVARPLPLPEALKLLVAVAGAVLITALVGLLVERLTISPARRATPLTLIIITVGVYIVLQGIAQRLWGTSAASVPAFTTLSRSDLTLRIGGLVLKGQTFWIWGVTALSMAGLAYFLERTMPGRAVRACSVNRKAAQLMGINPERMSMLAFALAAALGAVGGIVLAPVTSPQYDMGLTFGLKGFVAAIVGGMVSAPAAVLGGLLLGVIENLVAATTRGGFRDMFAFIILIFVLIYRPKGILGGAHDTEKV